MGSRKAGNLLTAAIVIGLIGGAIQDNLHTNRDTSAAESADSGVRVGDIAADFTLASLDGSSVKLTDYRGKKVLLNFWATWCPPCKAEMPHIEKFYNEMRDQGVVVLGVNLTDTEKSAAKVETFARQRELSFPIVLDRAGQVRDLYQVRAYPTSIVIDSRGMIRSKHQGAASYDSLRKAFDGIE